MQIRYEDYADTPGAPPFILNDNIRRTATLYSEKQNWHENIEIQYCKGGDGFVLIDGKRHAFSKGALAVIDSNAIHYTFSNTSMVYACIIINTDFCRQIGIDHRRLSFVPVLKSDSLSRVFEKICDEYGESRELRTVTLSYLLLELLYELLKSYSSTKSSKCTEQRETVIVKKLLSYIHENFQAKITLDMLSAYTLTDKYTLCKLFKKNTGQTIFQNLNAYRCIRASEYIVEGKNISEAAHLCGFENLSFFTKTFKKYIGVLPSRFNGAQNP